MSNDPNGRLTLVPVSLREAHAFVNLHHRHHGPARGGKFAVAVALASAIVGVAVVSRPVARRLDDGFTAEVVRLCTLGHKNACSLLYAASWRAARAMGYRRLVTYSLAAEGGASLRAAGFGVVAQTRGGSWDRAERPRIDDHPLQPKLRWEVASAI